MTEDRAVHLQGCLDHREYKDNYKLFFECLQYAFRQCETLNFTRFLRGELFIKFVKINLGSMFRS